MSDGKVVFEVEGDTSKVEESIKHVTDTIKNESEKWDSETSDSFKNVKSSASGASKYIGAAFQGAFQSLTDTITNATKRILKAFADWVIASIDLASDLEEVQNVVDVTFGEAGAQKIEEWSKKAGTQFGLTELQAKKFTSTIGAMMKSSGLTGDEIINMSTSLSGLAADLASFYNLDFETAFMKIRSGLSGEIEPLRQLGINMSVENMQDFLASTGSDAKFTDMNQAEQMVARYQYLMKATSDAQGDFVRTSGDSYANMGRQIETQTANLQQTVGENLLPLAKEFREDWLNFLKLLNGDNGVVVTGTENQLTEWINQETEKINNAREQLSSISEQWAEGFNMEYGVYDQNLYGSFGEYFYETLRAQQPFAGGKQRERIDSILSEMDDAYAQIRESETAISDFQTQLDATMSGATETTDEGAQTVSNFAEGMTSQESNIQAAVDSINAILSGLGAGISVPFLFSGGSFALNGEHETGLNYVPFDNYLASLHEGEGILTAEENRIWQRFKSGQSSGLDYDALGGVMRDNVHAGGNVYLDGRTVGAVVSDIQGRSYRNLRKSGWQA